MKAPSLAITSATPRHGGFVAKGRIGLVLSKALAIGAVAAVFATCGVVRAEIESRTDNYLMLEWTVRDTGIGIRPEDITRILTPFGQVASVYSRNHQGAGLGLSLTKALVERHGGHLRLHSAPGLGTTVRLSFPTDRLVEPQAERNRAIGLGVVD